MSKTLNFGIPLLVLCAIGYSVWYSGAGRWWPTQESWQNSLHADANGTMEQRRDAVENAPIGQKIDAYRNAVVEKKDLDNLIDLGRHNCPEGEMWDDNTTMHTKTMDLRNCDVGKPIWLQLADPYEAQIYVVRLYMYGVGDPKTPLEKRIGKKLVFIPEEPELKVKRDSPHFVAERVGPNTYKLAGEVDLFYRGNANFVELTRK